MTNFLRFSIDALQKKAQIIAILLVMLVSLIAHGWNMFHFPYFENDEGVYFSQAWSVINERSLAPYTYWYDHAPAGWLLLSIWILFTGGLDTFGFSLYSGRVFMLVLHGLSSLMLIVISKRLTNSIYAGLFAVIIFSLSPLGLYFQRRILLDNIMIFWVLVSLTLLTSHTLRLSRVVFSAIAFGIAVLSKESAIFFLPGLIAMIFVNTSKNLRKYALSVWIFITLSLISFYLIFALLKGEFFPYGSMLGGNSPHVSLIETLRYQSSRSGGSIFTPGSSDFWKYMNLWAIQDPVLILVGLTASLGLSVYALIRRKWLYFCLMALVWGGLLFLMRGGIVIEFYIIPLIPLLSLAIGLSLYALQRFFKHQLLFHALGLIILMMMLVSLVHQSRQSQSFPQETYNQFTYSTNHTTSQIDAISWIKENIPNSEVIVVDSYGFLEMRNSLKTSKTIFPLAHWYWKVDQDPEVRDDLLQNNYANIFAIATTPQMYQDIDRGVSPLTKKALTNSTTVKRMIDDIWGVNIHLVQPPVKILERSWSYYKSAFVSPEGRVHDPQGDQTTSESQAYTLLRSVWMKDKETFDLVWNWTKQHLHQPETGLFTWKYIESNNNDRGTAPDADIDIATALLFASKVWRDESYLRDAQLVINGIWNQEVKSINGVPYLTAGNWAKDKNSLYLNPSYLAPYAFRMFAEVDKDNDWLSLVDSSYDILNRCTNSKLDSIGSVGLPPNWCEIDKNGVASAIDEPGLNSTDYSYDALRVYWRLALDYIWYREPRSLDLLQSGYQFLQQQWLTENKVYSGYSHDGIRLSESDTIIGYFGSLPLFKVFNPKQAEELYESKVINRLYVDPSSTNFGSFWEDSTNYYSQNWGWFSTALFAGLLPNFWN